MKSSYLKPSFILSFLIISSSYLGLVTLLMNRELVVETLSGSYSFMYKMRIVMSLLEGMWTSMAGWGLFILIFTAILAGVNLTLLFERFQTTLRPQGMDVLATGGSLLGVIGSGCASCGFPLLPLVGLTAVVAYLPFRGLEFSYLSIGVLMLSTYLLIKNKNKQCAAKVCKSYEYR